MKSGVSAEAAFVIVGLGKRTSYGRSSRTEPMFVSDPNNPDQVGRGCHFGWGDFRSSGRWQGYELQLKL
ncbi:MAG: hypothetical protein AAB217_00985, partial [Chloroflexota bacterium]